MLYTGITRSANKILKEQSINTKFDEEKRLSLRKMTELAGELRDALVCNDLGGFGEILHQGWMEKRKLAAGISNQRIDEWYAIARQHGAVGGKVLGAGGGGFLLLFAPPESFQDIMRALPDLKPVPFNLEPQGSKIIYVEENGDST
jgi:D-glycero-alpha-D-manno-heptose-7-phosphate kinase